MSKSASPIPTRNAEHGTRYGYVEGCRCDACVEANTQYARENRKDREARAIPTAVKHNVSTYKNWGCRCESCRLDNARASYDYYHKQP